MKNRKWLDSHEYEVLLGDTDRYLDVSGRRSTSSFDAYDDGYDD